MVPKIMLTNRKTAGIRVPDHKIALALALGLGNPIISTSATDPEGTVFQDPSLLHDYFGNRLDAVIDGGPVPGTPSSVISLIDDEPEIIRYGAGDIEVFE
jgi:tRNA A37 threonylcarbamoyladenosine synthetase subunit TsaC/SUA5/YrdC